MVHRAVNTMPTMPMRLQTCSMSLTGPALPPPVVTPLLAFAGVLKDLRRTVCGAGIGRLALGVKRA
jgi:hypothetical protein